MKIYEYIVRIKDQASDKLRRLGAGISTGTRNIDKYNEGLNGATKATNSLGGVTTLLARFLGPAVLAGALIRAAFSASKLAREMEQTKISFEVMLGSAGKASSMLSEITDLANVTPFTRKELQENAKLLLNFGVSSKKILPTLKQLGDISGGNADRLYHLSLAFAQSSAAGRLMGQDLLQMVNAGFNPLQEISKKTGLSMSVLKKKMEDGAISTKMVEAAFRSATEEGGQFFGMMEKQSQTFEGRLSTLKDKMEIWGSSVGKSLNDAFSPVLSKVISWMDRITDKAGGVKNESDQEITQMRKLMTETLPLMNRFDELRNKKSKGGLTSKEDQEYFAAFFKLSKDLPAASVFNNKGEKVRFNTLDGSNYIAEQAARFNKETDKKVGDLYQTLAGIDRKIGINKTELKFNKTSKFGSKSKEILLQDSLAEKNKERNRTLELIDEIKSSRKSAFISSPSSKTTDANAYAALLSGDPTKGKGAKENGLDKITGGGKQSVNVTINLDSLVGTQNFDVKNIKETVRDMEKDVTEALLRVLNSANYAAAQ